MRRGRWTWLLALAMWTACQGPSPGPSPSPPPEEVLRRLQEVAGGDLLAAMAPRDLPEPMALNADAACELLLEEGKQEARAFLAQGRLVTAAGRESEGLVEQLYAAGAAQVWAVAVTQSPQGAHTSQLVIELPNAPDDRQRLLRWLTRWEEGEQATLTNEDTGQQYHLLTLDG